MATVIYGPQATGKTMLAAMFSNHYGCTRVFDLDAMLPSKRAKLFRRHDLVLTNASLGEVQQRFADANIIHINDARIAIGRDPAPEGGFRPGAPTVAACECRCHTGTCGENAMVLAERTIRLIEKLRPHDARIISEIERIVDNAGVDFAREAIGSPDDGVPF